MGGVGIAVGMAAGDAVGVGVGAAVVGTAVGVAVVGTAVGVACTPTYVIVIVSYIPATRWSLRTVGVAVGAAVGAGVGATHEAVWIALVHVSRPRKLTPFEVVSSRHGIHEARARELQSHSAWVPIEAGWHC